MTKAAVGRANLSPTQTTGGLSILQLAKKTAESTTRIYQAFVMIWYTAGMGLPSH